MSKFDPLAVPNVLGLLGCNRVVAAFSTGDDQSFVLWYYDPTNRVFTPGIQACTSPADVILGMSQLLLNKTDTREVLKKALELCDKDLEAQAQREKDLREGK